MASGMKPIWYLDVDGVLNIARPIPPHDVPEACWHTVSVAGFTVRWDQRVVDFINAVHRDGQVEVVWLTTWEGQALKLFASALGLDAFRLPRLGMGSMAHWETVADWWKFNSVCAHAEEDRLAERAVIWTDDDLWFATLTNPAIDAWEEGRKQAGLATLGITPRSSRGLTPEHLDKIRGVLGREAAAA